MCETICNILISTVLQALSQQLCIVQFHTASEKTFIDACRSTTWRTHCRFAWGTSLTVSLSPPPSPTLPAAQRCLLIVIDMSRLNDSCHNFNLPDCFFFSILSPLSLPSNEPILCERMRSYRVDLCCRPSVLRKCF